MVFSKRSNLLKIVRVVAVAFFRLSNTKASTIPDLFILYNKIGKQPFSHCKKAWGLFLPSVSFDSSVYASIDAWKEYIG